MQKLDAFFSPQSVAVIGASNDEGKVGNVIAKNVANLGYAGKVFFINPKHEEILGQKCYAELKDIGEKIDLAIIVIPAKFVNRVIQESSKLVKNYVIISAGFSEVGAEGEKREEELKKIAQAENLNILGPNCLGFIIPSLKLNASFAGGMPGEGNISFVSQSGALAVGIMDIAESEEIKFSSVISIGNKAELDEAELLEYLGEDEKTKVIGMYLESIKNGPRFLEVAQKVSQKKPIVILKAGKSEKAQKAISSHTGALAGSNAIMDALFEKAGILRADDFEDFFSLVNLISRTEASLCREVAVITNAGGPGVLTADAFEGKEIKLANLSQDARSELRSFLPEESSVENPIDLLGDALEDRYQKALETVDREKEIGTIISVLTPQDQTPVEKIAGKIMDFKKITGKSLITIFIGGEKVRKSVLEMEKNGIPNFYFPNQCVNSLNKYYLWRNSKKYALPDRTSSADSRRSKTKQVIEQASKEKRSALFFTEAKEIMELYEINTIETERVESMSEEKVKIGFPVVLKVDSDKVLHKTDKQGVMLNIENKKQLDLAVKKMKSSFPGANLIVQPMLPIQTELILGIKNDPTVGPVIIYGLGGIYTEIFKMVNFLIPPLSLEEVRDSLLNGKLSFLFQETRGQAPYNLEEIAQIILNISNLADEVREIKELDVNPLLAYNNGKDSIAIDVKIII